MSWSRKALRAGLAYDDWSWWGVALPGGAAPGRCGTGERDAASAGRRLSRTRTCGRRTPVLRCDASDSSAVAGISWARRRRGRVGGRAGRGAQIWRRLSATPSRRGRRASGRGDRRKATRRPRVHLRQRRQLARRRGHQRPARCRPTACSASSSSRASGASRGASGGSACSSCRMDVLSPPGAPCSGPRRARRLGYRRLLPPPPKNTTAARFNPLIAPEAPGTTGTLGQCWRAPASRSRSSSSLAWSST